MSNSLRLSDYCLSGKDTHWPSARLYARLLLGLQGNMYFTGLGGVLWRFMGVQRSDKNPNLCQG